MKLRNYFLLSIVVGAAFACSSNEDIPEEHVFTPNATLSLAADIYGDSRTKASSAVISEEEEQENRIHELRVLVFSGKGENAVYQTEGSSESESVNEILVEAGATTIVVLANSGVKEGWFRGKILRDVLSYTQSLESENLTEGGLSMSSKVIETDLVVNMHNIFGKSEDLSGHNPHVVKGDKVELYRHVAQVNLKSIKIAGENVGAKFKLEEVFVANVKGYSHILTTSDDNLVEASDAPEGASLWWYGDCFEDAWNGEYKITRNGVEKNFLAWTPETIVITNGDALDTEKGKRAVASFYVYENRNNTPLGQRTLLVLKGQYIDGSGRDEGIRYYTISVNDPDMKGSVTTAGGSAAPDHSYVKRNYRYNISLTINSSGSDRPYDPVTEACMDVAVTVADWDVIEQNEDLD
ncbi:MAG: hypothetical protein J6J40_07235 [Parabacteroides sp.]|nr:hypothetical protein [Parabacteroides sp.]